MTEKDEISPAVLLNIEKMKIEITNKLFKVLDLIKQHHNNLVIDMKMGDEFKLGDQLQQFFVEILRVDITDKDPRWMDWYLGKLSGKLGVFLLDNITVANRLELGKQIINSLDSNTGIGRTLTVLLGLIHTPLKTYSELQTEEESDSNQINVWVGDKKD